MANNTNPHTFLAAEELQRFYIPHLRTQFEHAAPILFTGAGFSAAAKNVSGQPLPLYAGIREQLWNLCFPDDPVETGSDLQILFDHALIHHRAALADLVTRHLSVDGNSLPEWYETLFSFPWLRCYTLNIDDLAPTADRIYTLPRRVRQVSAARPYEASTGNDTSEVLEVVHLNGTLEDVPDQVTFSLTQFARRLTQHDPWYSRFAVDLLTRPVVIIGTRLEEPPLWQHLEHRGARGNRRLGELRPRSYLVTPELDKARRAVLAQLNIRWIDMTAEEFVTEVLSHLQDSKLRGLQFLKAHRRGGGVSSSVPDVGQLAAGPIAATNVLLGQEPVWGDLQSGRAIRRDSDDLLWSSVTVGLAQKTPNLFVVTGTAGSGKSTSLMGTCLRLVAEGEHVGWIDRDSDVSLGDVRHWMTGDDAPRVLAIDDADLYGAALGPFARDLLKARQDLLLLVAMRSTRVDRTLNPAVMADIVAQQFSMPPLTDGDIDGLLAVLDKNNRLGALKGMSDSERKEVFRQQCGRQLLIAMIEATSGRKFEEKAIGELTDLEGQAADIYAIIAVAHNFRFPLQRDEILLAVGDPSNEALNVVQQLLVRHIVEIRGDGYIQARHRVIAEILHDELQKQGLIVRVLSGLAFVAASKIHSGMQRRERPRRMLRQFINHDYLLNCIGLEQTRNMYGQLESLLSWDYHYWLQRGSVEVEKGDLSFARQFLNQARSINSNDPFVENEWAYLLFREAIEAPGASDAQASVDTATMILEDLIQRDSLNSYSYHVLGSQGLSWSRRGIANHEKKTQYLRKLLGTVEEGTKKHPRVRELGQLLRDIQKEYLGLAVFDRVEVGKS